MHRVEFLQDCELAKYPADPLNLAYCSKDKKHLFPRGFLLYATSVSKKEEFTEITLNKPIHNYYRWYVPKEYVEKVRITYVSPVGCTGTIATEA